MEKQIFDHEEEHEIIQGNRKINPSTYSGAKKTHKKKNTKNMQMKF